MLVEIKEAQKREEALEDIAKIKTVKANSVDIINLEMLRWLGKIGIECCGNSIR